MHSNHKTRTAGAGVKLTLANFFGAVALLALVVFFYLLITGSGPFGYPPLEERPYTGTSEAAAISVGNEARDR